MTTELWTFSEHMWGNSPLCSLFNVMGGNPCYSRKEVENGTQRQTDNLCADVFSSSDWCGQRWDTWEVSRAHPPPTPPAHSITTTTSSWELTDLRAGCQGGSGPHRQLGTAISTQLLAMYCISACNLVYTFICRGSQPESMLEESACGCKAEWLCIYSIQKDEMDPCV